MSHPIERTGCGTNMQHCLRNYSERLLGPARKPVDDHDEVGFQVNPWSPDSFATVL
jgi:hypothetical protein